ncbi:MAG: sulfur carrier protein ThiS [Xanthomonadales bacterium]|nr:sulfur carrier protein ThiS [Xanthomonadales bacterium]
MQIELNGSPTRLDADATVAVLIESLGLSGRRVAVEVNREIVPKSEHATRALADGDRVELVHALGGG